VPFDYELAAEKLAVLVCEISDTPASGIAKQYLLYDRPSLVRGALRRGEFGERGEYKFALVLNDTHAPSCEQFTATHELSHIVLEHPTPHVTAEQSSSGYHGSSDHERQANTLAILTLIPEPPVDRSDISIAAAAAEFGVLERHAEARVDLEEVARVARQFD
jgi:hypothetical protein